MREKCNGNAGNGFIGCAACRCPDGHSCVIAGGEGMSIGRMAVIAQHHAVQVRTFQLADGWHIQVLEKWTERDQRWLDITDWSMDQLMEWLGY